jgi:hypothetical protein
VAPDADAIAAPLASFYRRLLGRCLDRAEPQEHVCECSSSRLCRRFHMTVNPLRDSAGLLIVNSQVVECEHGPDHRITHEPNRELYLDHHGFLHQCCHCRRFERSNKHAVWDWISPWVDHMPDNTSHGLCPVCYDYYYRPESRPASA